MNDRIGVKAIVAMSMVCMFFVLVGVYSVGFFTPAEKKIYTEVVPSSPPLHEEMIDSVIRVLDRHSVSRGAMNYEIMRTKAPAVNPLLYPEDMSILAPIAIPSQRFGGWKLYRMDDINSPTQEWRLVGK